MSLRLRPLRLADQAVARAAHDELAREDYRFLMDWERDEPWSRYLERLRDRRRGVNLPPDRVPASLLVAVAEGEIVGRASIRHELNDWLARFGGHIGYAVRPAHRRRGHATEILRQALIVARAEGVEDVLVCCDEDNVASARTIERNGGVLQDVTTGLDGQPLRRYLIR
jgi:predicted acetyltransferase